MNKQLKNILVCTLMGGILLGSIALVEKKEISKVFVGMQVYIQSESDVYFVDEEEIKELVAAEFPMLRVGLSLGEVNLHGIEKKIESHPFVKNAEVFTDAKGMVVVTITQHVPIARIVRPMAADAYISSEGFILPTSQKHTKRVLLLSGRFAEQLMEEVNLEDRYPELMELIVFIQQDDFWSAQIPEIELLNWNNIRLYQQVGHQVIEFGDPYHLKEKFKKIMLLYEQILPKKGWDAYTRVSVKFKDQIICE
jgi:cell division protein FtsQ